jgi:hypothetical protein
MVDGFFGTRANLIVDITILTFILLPFLMASTIYLAKIGKFDIHKRIQIVVFSFFISLCIILFSELQIGQLSNIVKQNPYNETLQYNLIFLVSIFLLSHQTLLWLWLIVKSYKRYPIHFRFNHKKWGIRLFLNTLFTAIFGSLLYWMIFIS